MDIAQIKKDGCTIVAITGEIDLNSSPQLRKAFVDLIEQGAVKVIVDFANVSYIDSSGLATLIEMMQRVKRVQGTMHLSQMSDKIKSLFEITKLDKLFKIYQSQDEALAAI